LLLFFFKKKKLNKFYSFFKKFKSKNFFFKQKMNSADIRKEKPIGLLITFFVFVFIAIILWFVLIGVNNKKAKDTQCELDGKKEGPDCDEYVISEMYQQNVSARQKSWAGPILVLLLFIGLVIGFMFLKGYPFSSYLSYSQCSNLARSDPYGGWAWSLPYFKSTFGNLFCKMFGACECRSMTRETDCEVQSLSSNEGFVYNNQIAAKKHTNNTCACCNQLGGCGKLDVNASPPVISTC